MRRLLKFKSVVTDKGIAHDFVWEEVGEKGLEKQTLHSTDYARPELDASLDELRFHLVRMCELAMDSDWISMHSRVHEIQFKYPKEEGDTSFTIKGIVFLKNSYNALKLNLPWWPFDNAEAECEGTVEHALNAVTEECWRFIDGDRAQQKLFSTEEVAKHASEE